MTAACNNFTLTGNIAQALQLRTTEKGKKFMFVTIAVNSGTKDNVDFISFIIWEKLAENVMKYCHKGDCISVHGYISTIKKDNNTFYQLNGDAITFLHKAAKKEEPKPAEPEKDEFVPVAPDPFAPFNG